MGPFDKSDTGHCTNHLDAPGDTIVQLGPAEQLADGFRDQQSLEVSQHYRSPEELQPLQQQAYPDAGATAQLRMFQPFSPEQLHLNPNAGSLLYGT
jgi:hypothetical protein